MAALVGSHPVTRVGLLLVAFATAASGCAPTWELIGERDVAFRMERDEIQTTMDGRFRRIVLEVGESDVEVLDVRVELADGQIVDVPVRRRIVAGSRTRVIDFPGGAHVVRDVNLTYRTDGRLANGRAHVFVYGQR